MLSLNPDSAATQKKVPTAVYADDDLKPSLSQEKVEVLVSNLLSNYHFRKVKLSDSLSSVVFDNYLKDVDGNKMYLLASDAAGFEKYRNEMDDFLANGNLNAPYEMYNLFRKRYRERSTFIQDELKKPLDFNTDETLNTNREKAEFAKTPEELNDLWRKMIKNEALELKIAGKADTAIVSTMRDRYASRDKFFLKRVRSEDVFQMYVNSYTEALDPHTSYMNPKTSDRFNQEMSQSLEGIGAILREEGNYIKIVEVVAGGPAFRSDQVHKEDKIVAVAQGENGKFQDIVGWFVDDAVKLIKGPKGTTVRLQILAANSLPNTPPKEVKIVREKIKLEDRRAKKEIVTINQNKKDYKIGVINLPEFYRDFEGARQRDKDFASTTRDVQKLVEELKAQNVDGLVIDLRNNGGGSLTEAVSLTGLFISRGPVVQVKEQSGEIESQNDPDPTVLYDGPLAVLVNRFSASASEIFAAAIQDYKRGVVVGEQTYGKGTVQTLIDLNQFAREKEPMGQLKLTVQKFYRINGSSTQRKGVTPDVELPSFFAASEYGEDSQLSALPWDQIGATRYDATKIMTDKVTARLRDRYQQRLKTDIELKQLVAELDRARKAKENTTVSLLESKRRKENEENERQRKAIMKLNTEVEAEDGAVAVKDKTKKKKDIYLTECGRVLIDLTAVGKASSLANR